MAAKQQISKQFLTVHGGEYTINVLAIADIDWTVSETSCRVTLITGKVYDLEDEDREALISLVD